MEPTFYNPEFYNSGNQGQEGKELRKHERPGSPAPQGRLPLTPSERPVPATHRRQGAGQGRESGGVSGTRHASGMRAWANPCTARLAMPTPV